MLCCLILSGFYKNIGTEFTFSQVYFCFCFQGSHDASCIWCWLFPVLLAVQSLLLLLLQCLWNLQTRSMILNPECLELFQFQKPTRLDKAVMIALMSVGLRKDVIWAFGTENNTMPSLLDCCSPWSCSMFISPPAFPFSPIIKKLWSFAVNHLGFLMIWII